MRNIQDKRCFLFILFEEVLMFKGRKTFNNTWLITIYKYLFYVIKKMLFLHKVKQLNNYKLNEDNKFEKIYSIGTGY
jgi:hypothetical protein